MAHTAKTALLGAIIDYAGTFPPAALSLPDALKAAATFRQKAKHPWLLGRLAVTMADLKKIDTRMLIDAGADGSPWLFTALARPREEQRGESTADAFLQSVEWDLRELRHWNERGFDGPIRAWVVGYETRLPSDVATSGSADDAFEMLAPVLDRFSDLTRTRLDPYFEVSFDGDWRRSHAALFEAFSQWCEDDQEGRVVPGIKVRTGGDKSCTSEQLTEVIVACAKYGFRFKATQGLHEATTHGNTFGFVNLFAAVSFAESLGPDKFGKDAVRKCLDDSDASHFQLGTDALTWMDFRLTIEAIESARKRHGATFGSCSLDEPDAALK